MELEIDSRTFNRDAAVKVTNEANTLFSAKNHQAAAEKFSDATNLYNFGRQMLSRGFEALSGP